MDHNEHDEGGADVPSPDENSAAVAPDAVDGPPVATPGEADGVTDPDAAALDPTAMEPAALDPTAVEPAGIDPTAMEPAALDPTAVEPAEIDPTAMEPAALDPTAMEPAAIDPTAMEPAAIDPYSTEPGSVVPLAPDGVTSPDGDADGGAGGNRRRLLVIGAIVVGVLVIGAAAFAMVQSRMGSADDALVAIPEDAAFVMSIDLQHFTEGDRFDRLVAAIEPIAAETESGIETFDDALAEIDASLQEELGVNLTDDVLPWVGRSIAVSIDGVDVESEEPEGLVIAISVRDEDGATEFIDKLATERDTELERAPVEGASTEAYMIPEDGGWLLVEDGLLLLTLDEATMERSLATMDSGEGITGDEDYATLTGELPDDRGFRMFVDGDAFDEIMAESEASLMEELGPDTPTGLEDFEVPTFAAASGLTDLGIAFDIVSEVGEIEGGTIVAPPLEADLPADTLFFMGIGTESDPQMTLGQAIRDADQEAYDAVGDFGRDFLGIDSLGDLLDHLTPNFGLAVTPRQGSMPMAGAIPFDISAILSLGIDDRDAVVEIVGDIVDWLATAGIAVEENDGVWQVLIDPQAPPLLAWTVTDDSLRIATDLAVLDQFGGSAAEGSDTTAATDEGDDAAPDDFAALDAELPGDGLNFYVDIDGMADSFAAEDEARAFSGFDAAAAGIELRGDFQHAGMIIKLADPDEDGADALNR